MNAEPSAQPSSGPWPGRFVWHDLMTTDAAKSTEFYTALFGWNIEHVPMDGAVYHMITAGPGPIGGVLEEKQIPQSHWLPYLAVDNVDSTSAKCGEVGGKVVIPPTDIPQTGRFSMVTDPQGAYFSVYQGLDGSHGFDPDVPVPGRVCWNEVLTTDPDAALKFYADMFGWKDEPMDMGPMGTYHCQMLGDKQAGGIMKNPVDGAPSAWLVYFLVEDLEASTSKAKELGATAMMESVPIPEIGSFSMLADPVGAVFALFKSAKELGADCE